MKMYGFMIQTGKKSLSEMKEKLHKMKLEMGELEESIEECERSEHRSRSRYDDDDDYRERDREHYRDYDRDYRDDRREREYRSRY